jgi:hypothetical protein
MAELAHSFTMGLCEDPRCTALHFHLERESGEHFATMTVAVEFVPVLIEKIRKAAYEIEVTRKDY